VPTTNAHQELTVLCSYFVLFFARLDSLNIALYTFIQGSSALTNPLKVPTEQQVDALLGAWGADGTVQIPFAEYHAWALRFLGLPDDYTSEAAGEGVDAYAHELTLAHVLGKLAAVQVNDDAGGIVVGGAAAGGAAATEAKDEEGSVATEQSPAPATETEGLAAAPAAAATATAADGCNSSESKDEAVSPAGDNDGALNEGKDEGGGEAAADVSG